MFCGIAALPRGAAPILLQPITEITKNSCSPCAYGGGKDRQGAGRRFQNHLEVNRKGAGNQGLVESFLSTIRPEPWRCIAQEE